MNPSELRMMWMSQYNPDRISLEDATSTFFHPSSVGLSVVDDITQQQTTDLNPMMSLVGGEFGSHAAVAAAAAAAAANSAAAAAASLGVQPGTLLTANCNDIYGLAQMGSLHQQLLQQSAAATMFQPYGSVEENDQQNSSNLNAFNAAAIAAATANATCSSSGTINLPAQFITNEELLQQQQILQQPQQQHQQQQQQQVYDHTDDDGYDDGVSDLTTKQEIINIDDFVMMTDSNSYDDDGDDDDDDDGDDDDGDGDGNGDLVQNEQTSDGVAQINAADKNELTGGKFDEQSNMLITDSSNIANSSNISNILPAIQTASSTATTGDSGSNSSSRSSGLRSQRKNRKIEPINRPGLVLKTPIAYKGNIDPSVIPIQKDGMAVCERCGAIGVKHTFYTKSRRFCSMACSRGELYSLVINNKLINNQAQAGEQQNQQEIDNMEELNELNEQQQQQQQQLPRTSQTPQADMELALRVASVKNNHNNNHTNYRFRISNQTKITTENGFSEHSNSNSNALGGSRTTAALCNSDGNESSPNAAAAAATASNQRSLQMQLLQTSPKELRMFRDIMPQEELPQIPKLDRLHPPCPQMEKIISVRRKLYDPTHSYDWTSRLGSDGFYAAPVTCFPHTPGYDVWDNLGISMKVEVENTDCDQTEVIQPGQTPHSFWVATILNIQGYKALMRYEGFDDESHDFWVNLCSGEVHSVGWCATRGKPLIPPRTIENKYKDWKDFLVFRLSGARTLPSSFYNKVNDSMQSRFRLGLNLECVDKDRISQVRLATVTKIVGKRLFLRYFDSDDGFWCHEDSPIIHPVGWATTVGHNLAAPQDYLERMLAGREAMIEVHEDDATIELFKMNFTFEEYYMDGKTNSFVEGMKLEAVDPLNLSSICAATVMAVLKFGYMMIRIDSYQPDATGSDWFCYHEKSPNIFPIGFCASNNINLTPPNGYDPSTFNWQTYLQDSGSIPADESLFYREVPNHGFEVGMSLECADLMDPRLVCVATVARVVGRLLKIHFDGWTDEYDQWLDCESPDIYPVGWCYLVNHKLEGPPTPVTVVPKTTLKTKAPKRRRKKGATVAVNKANPDNALQVKTRTTIALKTAAELPKLNLKSDVKASEHQASTCYEDANSTGVSDLTSIVNTDEYEGEEDSNSLQSNQSSQQIDSSLTTTTTSSMVAAAMDVNTTTTTSTTTTMQTLLKNPATIAAAAASAAAATADPSSSSSSSSSSPEKVRKNQKNKTATSKAPYTARRNANSYRANLPCNNNKYIPRVCDSNESNINEQTSELAPDTWNVYDVSQFLRVNDCTTYCDVFSRNKIDGKHLLQLSKDETITLLGMKVGPALKIFDLIQQLKCKMNPSNKSRLINKNKYL